MRLALMVRRGLRGSFGRAAKARDWRGIIGRQTPVGNSCEEHGPAGGLPETGDQLRQRRHQFGGRLAQRHDAVRTSDAQLRARIDVCRPRSRRPVRQCAEARHEGAGPDARWNSSRFLSGLQATFGVRKPVHVVREILALDRRTWPMHRVPRRPEACIAPRRMTCCNAHHS